MDALADGIAIAAMNTARDRGGQVQSDSRFSLEDSAPLRIIPRHADSTLNL